MAKNEVPTKVIQEEYDELTKLVKAMLTRKVDVESKEFKRVWRNRLAAEKELRKRRKR